MAYHHELQIALEAARLAGKVVLEEYARFQVIADAPASISTEADYRAQEAILSHVRRAFPNDALCAEETTPSLANAALTGDRLWIVDPIDGTRGFARKNGEFSVMVAFVDRGEPVVGVVLEPAHGRLTYATCGGGCWRWDGAEATPVACRVSAVVALSEAVLVQTHSHNRDVPTPPVRAIQPARVVEIYSAGLKLALVARGEVDLYVNTYSAFHDWDACAGHILVTEAGGTATGLRGEELRYGLPGAWQKNGLLASNGLLQAPALAELRNA